MLFSRLFWVAIFREKKIVAESSHNIKELDNMQNFDSQMARTDTSSKDESW